MLCGIRRKCIFRWVDYWTNFSDKNSRRIFCKTHVSTRIIFWDAFKGFLCISLLSILGLEIISKTSTKCRFWLTPLDPSRRKGWALRVSGFAFQMPTMVMKPKALPVAILSHRLKVLDSYMIMHLKIFSIFKIFRAFWVFA